MWILTILFPTAGSDAVSASWHRRCHSRRHEVVPSRHLMDHLTIHLYHLAQRSRGERRCRGQQWGRRIRRRRSLKRRMRRRCCRCGSRLAASARSRWNQRVSKWLNRSSNGENVWDITSHSSWSVFLLSTRFYWEVLKVSQSITCDHFLIRGDKSNALYTYWGTALPIGVLTRRGTVLYEIFMTNQCEFYFPYNTRWSPLTETASSSDDSSQPIPRRASLNALRWCLCL